MFSNGVMRKKDKCSHILKLRTKFYRFVYLNRARMFSKRSSGLKKFPIREKNTILEDHQLGQIQMERVRQKFGMQKKQTKQTLMTFNVLNVPDDWRKTHQIIW
jgi:hypothetical protein